MTRFTGLRTIFSCDLRTLALVRVSLGALIIADLVLRARDFVAHYTDAGVLPRDALFVIRESTSASFHLVSGTPWIMAVLFILAGIVGFALLVGFHSRLAALISWIFLLSIDARNPLVGQGGDLLLRVLLFWSMFLPIGARFSVDAAMNPAPVRENRHFSFASAGLLIQVMCVYFFTALLKSGPVWLPQGTAVYFALANDALVTPIGSWLAQFSMLNQGLTYFVWFLEIAAPFLVFCPIWHVPLRLFALTLLSVMHIGFMFCLAIGLFPLISLTSLATLIPGTAWDWLARRSFLGKGIRIYYDGDCLFCEKTCAILKTFLILPELEIAKAQSVPEIHDLMQAEDSWVVVGPDGRQHLRWTALAWLVGQSTLFRPIGKLMSLGWLDRPGEAFYRFVAGNRMLFSRWSRLLLPYSPINLQPSRIANATCGLFLVTVLWVNVGSLQIDGFRVPAIVREISGSLRLNQAWTMFAPAPSRTSGWFVAVGELEDGTRVDIFRDRLEEPTWDKSDYLGLNYSTYRWRKYLTPLPRETRAEARPYYVQYLCREWNDDHPADQQVEAVLLYFSAETEIGPGIAPDVELLLSWKSDCGSDPLDEIVDLRRGVMPAL